MPTDEHRPRTPSFVAPVVTVVFASIALFVALLSFQTADSETVRAAEVEHHAAELALADASLAIERSAADELVGRLLGELGADTIVVRGSGDAAIAELGVLSPRSGTVGDRAVGILTSIDAAGGIGGADAAALHRIIETAQGDRLGADDALVDELVAASSRVMVPQRLLIGTLAAALVDDDTAITEPVLHELLELGVTAPTDLAAPAPGVTSDLFDELDRLLIDHGQVGIHEELVAMADDPGRRPTATPAESTRAAADAAADLEGVWLTQVDAASARFDADAAASDLRRMRFRIAGWAFVSLGAIVLAAGALSALLRRRTARSPIPATPTDPVTGFVEPEVLRRQVRRRVADPRYTHHLFGALDVARIEMITDGYGTAATQRVERLVAQRVTRAMAWLTDDRADAESIVARRRAGEYVLVIHSGSAIDVDLVRSVLMLRSGTAIPIGGDHVPVTYGVGLHLESGRVDVDLALDAADRAVLEHHTTRDLAPRPVPAALDLVRT